MIRQRKKIRTKGKNKYGHAYKGEKQKGNGSGTDKTQKNTG